MVYAARTFRCTEEERVRTNIELDDELVAKGMALSGAKTKRELVDMALREFVESRSRLDLRDLRGKIAFSGRVQAGKGRKGGA